MTKICDCDRIWCKATESWRNEEAGFEEKILNPGDMVLWRNHTFSNKADWYHAELPQCPGSGVYSLRTFPSVKVHAAELKMVKYCLWPDYTRVSTRMEEIRSSGASPGSEDPRYNLWLSWQILWVLDRFIKLYYLWTLVKILYFVLFKLAAILTNSFMNLLTAIIFIVRLSFSSSLTSSGLKPMTMTKSLVVQ